MDFCDFWRSSNNVDFEAEWRHWVYMCCDNMKLIHEISPYMLWTEYTRFHVPLTEWWNKDWKEPIISINDTRVEKLKSFLVDKISKNSFDDSVIELGIFSNFH